jgi:ADP-ribose pyrophosphatase YjhB (NUDIX family)
MAATQKRRWDRFLKRGENHPPVPAIGAIQEVMREPTAGGVVYRVTKKKKIEILLVQDARNRWTIPKGHIEPGETARQTAGREVKEETGLRDVKVHELLGKIHFRFRRGTALVLMTTQIFLVEAKGDTTKLTREDWMNAIKWMPVEEAFNRIAYEDISRLVLIAAKIIRTRLHGATPLDGDASVLVP